MPLTGDRSSGMFMKEVKEQRVKEGSRLDEGNFTQRQIHALATGASYYGAAASSISYGDSNVQDCHYLDRMRAVVQKSLLPRRVVT